MKENTQKVIEYINHHLMADYMQKLTVVEMKKVTLFSTFPITGAINISDPQYFIKVMNPEVIGELLAGHVN